jgi:hypothetical protein
MLVLIMELVASLRGLAGSDLVSEATHFEGHRWGFAFSLLLVCGYFDQVVLYYVLCASSGL